MREAQNAVPSGVSRVRVWDLPTRVFHWTLATSVLGSYLSSEWGEMEWHARFGYFALSLILFRLGWGLWGGRYARFSSFLRAPRAVLAYVKGTQSQRLGHNPLGGYSVVALLVLVLVQALTGLATDDNISFRGPLVAHLSEGCVSVASSIHANLQGVLYAMIGLHLAAIAFYFVKKKRNLVGPMISGDAMIERPLEDGEAPSQDDVWLRLGALATWLAALSLILTALTYLSR